MPQLDISTYSSQIFWLVLCFIILYASLRYVFIPRIENSIAKRDKRIQVLLREAKEMNLESESLNNKYMQAVKHAHVEAAIRHKKEIEAFEKQYMQKIAKLAQDNHEVLLKLEEDIHKTKKQFLGEIDNKSKNLLSVLLEKLSISEIRGKNG